MANLKPKTVKCYLVGGGPGDLGLLTLKAKKLLEKADYVFYDELIPHLALNYCSFRCKKIAVGKLFPLKTQQSKINNLVYKTFLNLTRKKKGGMIVRFKGGDPSIFGRLKEELEFLVEKKIPYEIVPGISSFYSAASYAGIPLTARGIASNFSVLTGHFEKPHEKIKVIKASHTMVYLMGIKNLAKIVRYNLQAGKSPHTPVAIVEWGTHSQQRVVQGSLRKIVDLAQQASISHPGIVIIGKVVNLRNKLFWYEKKPLFNTKIGILKSVKELSRLANPILEKGGQLMVYPILEYQKIIREEKKLVELIESQKIKTIVFSSANAINRFFEVLIKKNFDSRQLANFKFLIVGKKTAQTLEKYYFKADFIANPNNQEGLWEVIKRKKLNNLLIPRSKKVRDFLEKRLISNNYRFYPIVLYSYKQKKLSPDRLPTLLNLDFLIFTSPLVVEAFHHYFQNCFKKKDANLFSLSSKTKIICIGEITLQKINQLFPFILKKNILKVKKSSFSEIVNQIVKIATKNKN